MRSNPVKRRAKPRRIFKGFIDPQGDVVEFEDGQEHMEYLFDLGNVDYWRQALERGWVRIALGSANILIELYDLKRRLPDLQRVFLPVYENIGEYEVGIEDTKSHGDLIWTKLSTLVLGTESEIRRGLESNPRRRARR